MMELRRVSDNFAVAAQMQPEELAALAAEGFTAVICARPDGEEPGQPSSDAMRDAAQAAGLAFHHIPVSGGIFPPASIAGFAAVQRGTHGKVLGYCRSGTRAVTLDALANIHGLSADERISRAASAGYDLSSLIERLESGGETAPRERPVMSITSHRIVVIGGGSPFNAKTAASARKQAAVVAVNVLRPLEGKGTTASYDGLGSQAPAA